MARPGGVGGGREGVGDGPSLSGVGGAKGDEIVPERVDRVSGFTSDVLLSCNLHLGEKVLGLERLILQDTKVGGCFLLRVLRLWSGALCEKSGMTAPPPLIGASCGQSEQSRLAISQKESGPEHQSVPVLCEYCRSSCVVPLALDHRLTDQNEVRREDSPWQP